MVVCAHISFTDPIQRATVPPIDHTETENEKERRMSDERNPAGSPSTPSADDVTSTPEPPAGGGFLIDDQELPPLDGEQLFRQAVAPAPPRSPQATPMFPLPDPAPDEDDPAPPGRLTSPSQARAGR